MHDMMEETGLPGAVINPRAFDAKFKQWRGIVDKMHAATRFTPNDELAWTAMTKPLASCTVALVSTAGVHLRSQETFNLLDEQGDATFRVIPGDSLTADLRVSHSHYDTADANDDPNVVFPLDRLRELVEEGSVGATSPVNIGMMGWNPDGTRIKMETGPAVGRILVDAGVDAVVLTPG